MTLSAPEQIDEDGVINVHARGSFVGANIPVREKDQSTGAIIDLSAVPLFFEIHSLDLRKALPADPTNPKGRLLPNFSVEELAPLALGLASAWELWDESGGHRVVMMRGTIRTYA